MCGLDGLNNVRRIAAGGNRQQHIARLTQRTNLFGEDFVVAVVVGNRGDGGGVGGQRDSGQARSLALETVEQLRGKVLSITRRTAVAAGEHLALVEQGVDHHLAGLLDVGCNNIHRLLLGVDAGLKKLANSGLHVHL